MKEDTLENLLDKANLGVSSISKFLVKLFNSTNDIAFLKDEDLRYLVVNQRFLDQFKFTIEEILGKRDSDLLPNDIAKKIRKVEQRVVNESIALVRDEVLKGRVFQIKRFPVGLDENRVGVGAIIQEVTDFREQTESLKKYQKVIERLTDPIMIKSEDGEYKLVNPAVSEYLDIPREEILGKTDEDLFGTETGKKIWERERQVLESEEIMTYEESFKIHGKTHHFKTTRIPHVNDESGDCQILSICRDITDKKEKEQELKDLFVELAEIASRIMSVRDPYTHKHAKRVAKLSREVGRRMGLEKGRLMGLYIGGILHDIGKTAIPGSVLTKPGKLSDAEWQMIKSHPEIGYEKILGGTTFPWPIAEMILHHHERLDGSGYPYGLKGDQLSLEVRIVGAVDVVEAMSTRRPYRDAKDKQEVVKEMTEGRGTKYDQEVVDILIGMIEEGKV